MANRNRKFKGRQGKKDSSSKRVNYDNERESKFDKEFKDPACTDKSNDVRWYAHNPELLRSAASIPFSQTVGSPLEFRGIHETDFVVPGVLGLAFQPTLGGIIDDAVNASKDSMYSYVVHANSRNTSYNSTDLMLIVLAGANVFAAFAAGVRAYGAMRLYDQRNKYLPKALIQTMGFNFDDLQANLSKMWFDLNNLSAKMSQIWIPNTLPIMDRWFWLNSNIYMDGESIKSQYYLFVQRFYWQYSEMSSSQGGELLLAGSSDHTTTNAYDFAAGNITWNGYMTMINGMIDALINSEDRGVMMGDILKAYGAERIYAVTPVPVEYQILPVYDREVLTQIENCSVTNTFNTGVYQNPDTNKLYNSWGTWTAGSSIPVHVLNQQILNFHQKEVPTPEQIMVATRLMALGFGYVPDANGKVSGVYPSTSGTEIVVAIKIATYQQNGTLSLGIYRCDYNPGATNFEDFSKFITLLSAFDWAPWVYRLDSYVEVKAGDTPPTTNPYKPRTAIGDWQMYTVIERDTLHKMHTTAVYSEFGVPVL